MKKYLLALLVIILFPTVVHGAYAAGWQASSTTQGWIFPTPINGVYQTTVVPNIIATSTLAGNGTSTFNGNILVGTALTFNPPSGLNVPGAGVLPVPTALTVGENVNNIVNGEEIWNTNLGFAAGSCYSIGNGNTTNETNPAGGTYYTSLCMSGPNFNAGNVLGYSGLPANSAVLTATDGGIEIAATSANIASSSINFGVGPGFSNANYDVSINDDTKTPGTANVGIGSTTPGGRLTIIASSTNGNPYFIIASSTNQTAASTGGQTTVAEFEAPTGVSPGALLLGTGTDNFPSSGLEMINNFGNTFGQAVFQNTNAGNRASTDLIFGGDLMTNSTYYGDLGCNSSTNSDPNYTDMSSKDCYLYSSDSNLDIGTASTTGPANVRVFTSGTTGGSTETAEFNSVGLSIAGNGNSWFTPTQALDVKGNVNIDRFSSYMQTGNTLLYGSTTSEGTFVGFNAGSGIISSSTSQFNTIIGDNALEISTTTTKETVIGGDALANFQGGTFNDQGNIAIGYKNQFENFSGNNDVSVGEFALMDSATPGTGNSNVAIGSSAMSADSSGSFDVAIGSDALLNNITGIDDVAIGHDVLSNNQSASTSVAVGFDSQQGTGAYAAQNNTSLGYFTLADITTGANENVAIGHNSGSNITTGSGNTLLGDSMITGDDPLTTGSQNVLIGYRTQLASTTANGQLNIGNILYGANNTAILGAVSTGQIGIGTTTPYAELTVATAPGATGSTPFLFLVASSTATGTTTPFAISNSGWEVTSGTLPTTTSCGSTSAVSGNQSSGDVMVTGTLVTSCTINFVNPVPTGTTLQCTADDNSTASTASVTGTTTSSVTVGFPTGLSTVTIWWNCSASLNSNK